MAISGSKFIKVTEVLLLSQPIIFNKHVSIGKLQEPEKDGAIFVTISVTDTIASPVKGNFVDDYGISLHYK